MNKFFELDTEKRAAFYIGISEKCVTLLKDEQLSSVVRNALDCCWDWLISEKYDGDFLYELLDNEEDGITVILEEIDNETEESILNCVIDTVAFTSRLAYDKADAKYYPEPIEMVDDELVKHLLSCFNTCFNNDSFADHLLDYLLSVKNTDHSEWKREIQNMI